MEIGNEIGQKIRSAIKAKLVDLGAYVDDELPDYIMVMVANKKTQTQMSDDLSLFLGSNTTKFTTWLHSLLEKLQSITTVTDSSISSLEQTGRASLDAAVAQSGPQLAQSGDSQDVYDTVRVKKMVEVHVSGAGSEVKDNLDVNISTHTKRTTQKRDSAEFAQPVILSTNEEPVIKLHLEHDEFEDESMATFDGKVVGKAAFIKPSHTDTEQPPRHHHARGGGEATEGAHKKSRAETEEYIPEKYHPPASRASRQVSVGDKTAAPISRRRVTGLESLVGAVLKHDNEDNDEYDPCRPAIGNVASIVKVTDRKSSVPLSMQASKSLLLKAMQQAEQSVASIKRREVEDSLRRSDNRAASSRQLASVHRRIGVTEVKEEPVEIRTVRSSAAVAASGTYRVAGVGRDARLLLDEAKEMRVSSALVTKQRDNNHLLVDRDLFVDHIDMEDTRRVHCSPSDDDDSPERKIKRTSHRSDAISRVRHLSVENELERKRVMTDEMEEAAGVDDDEDENELRKILIQQTNEKIKQAVVTNPKFVVTLNNVYPLSSEGGGVADDGGYDDLQIIDVDDDLAIISPPHSPPTTISDVPRNVVRVRPQFVHIPSSDNTSQAEGGVGQGNEVNENQKSSERCVFWPVCKNGESCPFQHPTVACKTFPMCRFGDKCLYIHPTCRYDGQCAKPNCPYTHVAPRPSSTSTKMIQKGPVFPMRGYPKFGFTSKAVIPVVRTSNATKCKFFPNCTDVNCAFAHPKPCRYGVSCTSKSLCPYSHPLLPAKNQMKWTAAQQ